MTQFRINWTRTFEFLSAWAIIAAFAFLLYLVCILFTTGLAHQTGSVTKRVGENRYMCYTADELIKQLDMMHHSQEVWHPGDRAQFTHELLEIYKICQEAKQK